SSPRLMTLKQTGHRVRPVLAFTSASASARTSSSGRLKRWKASRCALLGPMPGRRPSSRMSVIRALGKRTLIVRPSGGGGPRGSEQPAHPAEPAHAAHRGAHLLLLQLLGAALGLAHGGGDEVLEHLDVLGVDHLWVDAHGGDGAVAGGG